MLPVTCIRFRGTLSAIHRSTSARSGTRTKSSKPEHRRDKKTKLSIASLRARRQSRVDQREWDPARVRCGGEIGPNLRFDKNNPRGTNHRKCAVHNWPVIERRVHDFHPGRRSFARQSEPSRVVVVSTHRKSGSSARNALPSFNAMFTSPTLTACSRVKRLSLESRFRWTVVNSHSLAKFFAASRRGDRLGEIRPAKGSRRPTGQRRLVDEPNHAPLRIADYRFRGWWS